MEIYNSEDEQLEAVKKWWQANGRSVIAGVAAGIVIMVGWSLWQNHQSVQAEQASIMYEQLKSVMEKEDFDTAEKLAEKIVELHDKSLYATFADFFQAKLKVESGDFEGGKTILQRIVAHAGDDNFRHLARLRLGQVMLANEEFEAGLKLLSEVKLDEAKSFEGSYEELRGDLYLGLGRVDEARAAYREALSLEQGSPLLQMKIDDLGGPKIPEPST
ncbi:MAG: tetratricopeptide repeat protein [Pseudomonadota bacterium]